MGQLSTTTPHQKWQKIQCNTENYVPVVVPGLSRGSFRSTASTSPASLPQDTADDKSRNNTTSKCQHSGSGRPVAGSCRNTTKLKIRTPYPHRETCCEICHSGQRSSQKIYKMKECRHQGTHPQALLMIQIRNVPQKRYRESTVSLLTSRKSEIAKYATEPRLQGLLAGNALVMQYLEQKTLVT